MTDSSSTQQQTNEALIINSTLVESVVILEEFYEVYGVMLLTASCIGAATFVAMGFVMSKALGRCHYYLWLPIVMFIVGFTFTSIILFAPGFLFSVLVYTSNFSAGGVELRLVIAMGLVQGFLVNYFDLARWRQG